MTASDSLSLFKIGFHSGAGGVLDGIGDHWRALDAARRPAILKAADGYGPCWELGNLARASGVPHQILFRLSGPGYDNPDYSLSPDIAAEEHWYRTTYKLPPEFDKDLVWLEIVNEVDKERAEWLAEFALAIAQLANAEGYKVALFGWSTGHPEPAHWEGPKMLAFLRYCAEHPDTCAIALHEYSLLTDALVDPDENGNHWLVGRFEHLHAVCDCHDIPRPTIHITEFGWTHNYVPEPAVAMPQLREAADLYARYPNIQSVAIWYLGGGYDGVASKTNRLIQPLTAMALEPGWLQAPADRGKPRVNYHRRYVVFHDSLGWDAILAYLRRLLARGERPTAGWSADDAGIGDLDSRIAELVGFPEEVHATYASWYAREYPGTIVEFAGGNTYRSDPPGDGRGEPRVQYSRRYICFHPALDPELGLAYVASLFRAGERPTFGFSFDDACIGDLDNRIAEIAGCPEAEKAAYAAWVQRHYPGVAVRFADLVPFADGFDAPVGTEAERHTTRVWPGAWIDATGYARSYSLRGSWQYHTGVDLNCNQPSWDYDNGRPVWAVASGVVTFAGWKPAWGNLVVIGHHPLPYGPVVYSRAAHLGRIDVVTGQQVVRGQQIGTIGRDAYGGPAHLHFDISPTAVLCEKPEDWPGADRARVLRDYVDPLEFIVEHRPGDVADPPPPPLPPPPPGTGRALLGLHGPADPGNMVEDVFRAFTEARVEAIKVAHSHSAASISRLVAQHPGAPVLIRIQWKPGKNAISPAQFVVDTIGDLRRALAAVGSGREVWIEIHNEPNLRWEGLDYCWHDGTAFNAWLLDVIGRLRAELPGVKLLYPGLSPGSAYLDEGIDFRRQDHLAFLHQSLQAARACDGVALHVYWNLPYPMDRAIADIVGGYVSTFPGTPLFVSEASNNDGSVSAEEKAAQYIAFPRALGQWPQIRAVFYFVVWASNPTWGWGNSGTREVWAGSRIPALVGARS